MNVETAACSCAELQTNLTAGMVSGSELNRANPSCRPDEVQLT